MSTNWQTWPVKFQGGWRTDLGRIDQGIQAPGSATILRNFEPSINGGYSRIKGFSKFSPNDVDAAEANPVLGVVVIAEASVLARKGACYYTGSGGAWTKRLTVTTPGASRIFFDIYNYNGTEKVVVVDGVEDPAFWNGSTMTLDTAAPAEVTGASLVRSFKSHLFFAKGDLLTFTAPFTDNDYNTGNGAGQIRVGGPITGLIVFRDELIIFTPRTIQRLSGSTAEDFTLSPIASDTGCLCAWTVQEVGGDILYLGPDGIRWLSATARNNDFGLDRASANIQDEILQIISSNCAYASVVLRAKNQYRLFTYLDNIPASLSKGFIATKFSGQDVSSISWAELIGMKVKSAHSRQFRDREVIVFSSLNGHVYLMESGNSFDGLTIQAIFETPYIPINDPRVRFTVYKHSIYTKLEGLFNLTTQIKFDYNPPGSIQPPVQLVTGGSGGSVYGEGVYGTAIYSTTASATFLNMALGSGMVIALRYESNDTNAPYLLDYAILEYMTNERR